MSKKKKPIPTSRGFALPTGCTILSKGINFSIFARHAQEVILVINLPETTKTPQQHTVHLQSRRNHPRSRPSGHDDTGPNQQRYRFLFTLFMLFNFPQKPLIHNQQLFTASLQPDGKKLLTWKSAKSPTGWPDCVFFRVM